MPNKNAGTLSPCYLSWKEDDVETMNCLKINPFPTIHKTMGNVFISICLYLLAVRTNRQHSHQNYFVTIPQRFS